MCSRDEADLLVSQVRFRAEALVPQHLSDASGIFGLAVGDIHHHHLDRREPNRQQAGVMLDQDADETLDRAQDRAASIITGTCSLLSASI